MDGSILARIAAIIFVAVAITAAVVQISREEEGQGLRPEPVAAPADDPLRAEQRRCQELGDARKMIDGGYLTLLRPKKLA